MSSSKRSVSIYIRGSVEDFESGAGMVGGFNELQRSKVQNRDSGN